MTAQDKHLERIIAFCAFSMAHAPTWRAKRLAHRLWKEYRARRRPEVVQALEDAQWARVNGR